MKKTFKILLTIMLVASMLFVITGCGKKNETPNNNNAVIDNGKSKTFNAFNNLLTGNDYTLSMEDQDGSKVTMAIKGENIYMDVTQDGEHATIVYKDGSTYIISHDEKMYMVSEGKSEDVFSEEDMSLVSKDDLGEIENAEYKTGKEAINGTEYEYEEYNIDEEEVATRFYFEGNDLRYVKTTDEDGEETLIKVLELSPNVDDSLFEIPADYQKVAL